MSYNYSNSELKYLVNEPDGIKEKFKVAYTCGLTDYPRKVYSVIMYITKDSLCLRESYKTKFMLRIPLKNISKIKMCNLDLLYVTSIEEYLINGISARDLEIHFTDDDSVEKILLLNLALLKRNRKQNEFVELFELLKPNVKGDTCITSIIKSVYLESSTADVYLFGVLSVSDKGIYLVPKAANKNDLFISMDELISIKETSFIIGIGDFIRNKSVLEIKYYDENNDISTVFLQLTKSRFAQVNAHKKLFSQLVHLNIIDEHGSKTGDGSTE